MMNGFTKKAIRRGGARRRRWLRFGILPALAVIVLNVVAGIGLRRHDAARSDALSDEPPDILYLVAGARAQQRRVAALAGYARELAQGRQPDDSIPEVWIGNDFEITYWSKLHGRNLTRAEWAVLKLRDHLGDIADRHDLRIVPGRAWGTDGEMRALAAALRRREQFMDGVADRPRTRLTLVTCPSHSRRAASRLRAHAPDTLAIHGVTTPDHWREWMPWVTFAEWAKIVRDAAGLSGAPLISRAWYQRDIPEDAGRHGRWLSALLLGLLAMPLYAWLLYPFLLKVAASGKASEGAATDTPWPEQQERTAALPDPSFLFARAVILISAYNEATDIEQRLINLGEQDFPKDRFSVYVGVDGATDATETAARSGAARVAALGLTVHVVVHPVRRGKVSMLKTLAARALQEVPDVEGLVFTDANTFFKHDALRRLLALFSDPRVGGVCGRLVLDSPPPANVPEDPGHASEGRYWTWENRLKTWESRLDSCLGANGAIYVVRAGLFPDELPDNTIVDDLVIGMKVREQGYRMLYEPAAVAHELLPATSAEWRRRIRIGAGDFQALGLCRRCLSPRYGWFAWIFLSHKVLRWLTPHFLLAAWGMAALGLLRTGVAGINGMFFLLAAAGGPLAILALRLGRHRHAVDYLVAMQAALLVGSIQWMRGGLRGDWERTPRRSSEV